MDSKMAMERKDSVEPSMKKHVTWTRQIEFTLSCVGYAVGLGNLWRFPYLCMRNGGGAFLIPYFTMMVACGIPLVVLELVLGQFSSRGAIGVWKICPLLKGIGWSMVILTLIFVVYYNVLMAWILYFLFVSFRKEVPWKSCHNSWNSELCTELSNQNTTWNRTRYINSTLFGAKPRSPADEFWHNKVLDMSDGLEHLGTIKWEITLCLAGVGILLFLCSFQGIKTSGKVVYVTATVPYLFLTILLIRGVTLPGSLIGIKYFIIPDWGKLAHGKVWAEAGLQVFFSLGPAWGCMVSIASHNKFTNNLVTDTLVTSAACGLTSFYAGFAIFSVMGFIAHSTGQAVDDVIATGPGLAFVAYPQAIAELPIAPFWAICFFIMLLTLGVDGQFVCMDVVVSSVIDAFPGRLQHRRHLFSFAMTVLFFLLGLPMCTQGGMYIFQVIDWYIGLVAVFILAFLECIIVVYVYGIGRIYHEMSLMLGGGISYFWAVMWGGVTPAIILAICAFNLSDFSPPYYGDYQYPAWASGIGIAMSVIALVPIPAIAVYKIIKAEGHFWKRVVYLMTPEVGWGPRLEADRKNYKYENARLTWKERFIINHTTESPTATDEDYPGLISNDQTDQSLHTTGV